MKKVGTSLHPHILQHLDELVSSGEYHSRAEAIRASIHRELSLHRKILSNEATIVVWKAQKKPDQRGPNFTCPLCGYRMREYEAHQLNQTIFNNGAVERFCHCPECGYIWKQ